MFKRTILKRVRLTVATSDAFLIVMRLHSQRVYSFLYTLCAQFFAQVSLSQLNKNCLLQPSNIRWLNLSRINLLILIYLSMCKKSQNYDHINNYCKSQKESFRAILMCTSLECQRNIGTSFGHSGS